MIGTLPLLVMTTAYALFSQDLSINAQSSTVGYVSNQNMMVTYGKTATFSGGMWTYSMPVTVRNTNLTTVTAWQFSFEVPGDSPNPTCPTSIVCTKLGNTITVKNSSTTGTINGAATRTFTMSFSTATAAYTPQNMNISATYSATYQNVTGLASTIVRGTRTGSTWLPVISVNNNSTGTVNSWLVAVRPWRTTYSINPATVPSGVSYTTNNTEIVFTSTTPLAPGTSFQFQPTVTTTTSWAPTINRTRARGY